MHRSLSSASRSKLFTLRPVFHSNLTHPVPVKPIMEPPILKHIDLLNVYNRIALSPHVLLTSKKIMITEMEPYDGLQPLKFNLSAGIKASYINKLLDAGLKRIEVGAYVSGQIAEMANTPKILNFIQKRDDVKYIAQVLTKNHALRALNNDVINELVVFTSISQSFCKKNYGCDISTSIQRIRDIVNLAKQHNVPVSAHISCVFGCPFEGYTPEYSIHGTLNMVKTLLEEGCSEVKLADTIGTATPKRINDIVSNITHHMTLDRIGFHLHNPHDTVIENVWAAMRLGITRFDASTFDASLGILGGFSSVPNPSKKLSTIELACFAESLGYTTELNFQKLHVAAEFIEKRVKSHFAP